MLIFLSISLISACSRKNSLVNNNSIPEYINPPKIELDPVFRSFYNYYGGNEILGPAIASAKNIGNLEYQFVESGCITFDPNNPASGRFKFLPLENYLLNAEQGFEKLVLFDVYQTDYTVHPEFVSLYSRLGGEEVVGRAITEMRYNPYRERYEQYFMNLGFYRQITDNPGTVNLLSYGVWSCGFNCLSQPTGSSTVDINPYIFDPFKEFVRKFGSEIIGFPISKPYIAPDGNIEQIFERVVLFIDQSANNEISLRDVPVTLGMTDNVKPVDISLSPTTQLDAIEGNLSEIPDINQFIIQNGGYLISGEAISKPMIDNKGIFSQCFENYCLYSNQEVYEQDDLRVEMLGYPYRDIYYQRTYNEVHEVLDNYDYSLKSWVHNPSIRNEENQEFWVSVLSNGKPYSDIQPRLTLILSDGSSSTFTFPLTGSDGRSQLIVDSINSAHGSIIPYQVCIDLNSSNTICVYDDFLIWNDP